MSETSKLYMERIQDTLQATWHSVVADDTDPTRLLTGLGVLVLSFLLRKPLTHIVTGIAKRLAKRTATKVDDTMVEALEPPLYLVPIALGLVLSSAILEFEGMAASMVTTLAKSLLIIALFWVFYRALGVMAPIIPKFGDAASSPMGTWVVKGLRILVVVMGAAALLETWGIAVGHVVAGLGLFGVAVALGAQDLFKNLIAGLLVLAEKRFKPGDWVNADGVVEGTVETIGFRSTTIRRFDKAIVYVPNARLSDTPVVNFSAMTGRRIFWHIGVEYRTTVEQLQLIRDRIEAHLRENEAFIQPPDGPLFVHLDRFGASSIDIMLYTFTHTTVWGDWLAIKEQLAWRIKTIVEAEAGTGFAFPSQSIYVESLPFPAGGPPETFVPPGNDNTH